MIEDIDALLDGIGADEPKTKRASYPQYPDESGTAAMLAQTSIALSEAKDQLEANNRMLGEMIRPYFFEHYEGKTDIESSIRVSAGEGQAVLVTLKNQVKKLDSPKVLAPVQGIFNGREKELFTSSFEFKVSGDDIPTTALVPLITELKTLFAKHGATKALSVKKQFKPVPAFFTQRHTLFTPEQNTQIDAVMPVITSIKVKGVV